MGDHYSGGAIGRLAIEAERGRRSDETALNILDRICERYRGSDAEFEAEDPDRPGCTDPVCNDYRDPHPDRPVAALGRLMIEAFAPNGLTDLPRYQTTYEDDSEDGIEAHWEEVIFPFRKRYDFY